MTDPLIREYEKEDIPALVSLWAAVFGDSPLLAETFFQLLPSIGTCFVAEENGVVCGMASILTGFRVCMEDRSFPCAYLYAVAVDPSFRGRGMGAGLSKSAAHHGRRSGAELICTLPADEGLNGMYEKTIGTRNFLHRSKKRAESRQYPDGTVSLYPAEASEYNRMREKLLSGRPHLSVSDSSISFLKALCEDNGGGLYLSDHCAAAYYVDSDSLRFSELLCEEDEVDKILGHTAFEKGLTGSFCYLPSARGDKYIAFDREILPDNLIWNISFE